MRVARDRTWGTSASFGLALALFALAPSRVGPQDLASLLARQPGVIERWREHLIASPFGTIHAATFSFPRLFDNETPDTIGFQLASLGPDVTGAISSRAVFEPRDDEPMQFPSIDRTRKGDRLVPPGADQQAPTARSVDPAAEQAQPARDETPAQPETTRPAGQLTIAIAPPDIVPAGQQPGEPRASLADGEPAQAELETAEPDNATPTLDDDVSPAIRTARIYFGVEPMGGMTETMQPWGAGQEPIFEGTLPDPGPRGKIVSVPHPEPVTAEAGGETIAGKGQVTGEGRRPKSPAERLGLAGRTRAKAEKCLADAVYFEARGEPVRGQIAVAQVVMNRVFSGYYPDDVCGVVYQNANRHLACQFTFACDGIPDRVTEPDAWERAKRIARNTLDGKYWLDDVGKATHYHAYWVHPWWVREMRKLDRIGVHTFYRPRNWGDGSDAPNWGDAAATREAAKRL